MGFEVIRHGDSKAHSAWCSQTQPHSFALSLACSPLSFPCVQVWYDNRADDLTKEGMLKGIEEAAAFVLFLSPGVLQRPYCQMEIRHALALGKPVVLLHGERRDERSHTHTA